MVMNYGSNKFVPVNFSGVYLGHRESCKYFREKGGQTYEKKVWTIVKHAKLPKFYGRLET